MQVISVKKALDGSIGPDAKVEVRGWVRTRRDSKAGLSFIHLSDGSCFAPIQVVASSNLPNYTHEVLHLTAGCSVVCRGTLVPSQGKGQSFEVQADEVQVLGFVEDPDTYPIQPKQHSLEFLREVAHLRVRTNTFGAVARVRHVAAQAIHQFFNAEGFFWVSTPLITTSDAEGGGQMFRVSTLDAVNPTRTDSGKIDWSKDFFGKEAFLTVSGQLNVEAYCLALSKVYTFGPAFRAENSNTTRHLAEFWMIEPEIAFANLDEDAALAERFLKYVFKAVLTECGPELAFFEERQQQGGIARLESFLNTSFERLEYTEAIEILKKAPRKFEYAPEWGNDLQTEHERYLTEEYVGRPVVVVNYPEKVKSFYMRLNDDGKTVAAMDVLAPGIGEIIGGSQREERLDVFDRRLHQFGLKPEHYHWYRDLRRYGTVPHSGFGLGFERLIVYMCGLQNIRDAIPYPRVPGWALF
ncbi:asparagine--tRNA ligase [Corallococcus terminator]|uniref:Asparagine--tRNA ligase n=1 Tax=Corallococcus terminator TaxID=2316733 RepID=A0A3A8JDJ9_9BACT|nr:asparagine--tRNA ligase [Corallococcus terminator]RKG93769.1 asparagine--tRNA ligase [Corallococcus terminator]